MFEAIERGEIKALWVMATNPAVSLPRAGAMRDALKQARALRRFGERRLERHAEQRCSRCSSRRGVGREGRHGDEFRAAHLAPARVPAAARRGEARLVDRHAGRAAHGLWRRVRLRIRRRHFPRARRAVGVRERRHARFRYRRARATSATTSSTRSIPSSGRPAKAQSGDTRFFADGGFFTPDRKARFVAPEVPALRAERVERISRSCSTPAACATSGTP